MNLENWIFVIGLAVGIGLPLLFLLELVIVKSVDDLREHIDKRFSYPNCQHSDWRIDTQIKVVWCESCKIGNWYTVGELVNRQVKIKTDKTKGE